MIHEVIFGPPFANNIIIIGRQLQISNTVYNKFDPFFFFSNRIHNQSINQIIINENFKTFAQVTSQQEDISEHQ